MVKKIKNGSARKKLKAIQKDMVKKIGLFNQMGDECTACETPFDKTDIEMVKEWHVTVREGGVRIYCPSCWESARKIIKDFRSRIEKRMENENTH